MSTLFQNRQDRTLYVHDGAANYIVAYVFQIILQFLFSIIIIATMTLDERSAFSTTITYTIIICIVNELSIALTPLSYSKVLGQNYYKDMGFKKKISILDVVMLIGMTVCLIVAFSPIATWVAEIFINSGYDPKTLSNVVVDSPLTLFLTTIFLAILPACFEEILYRGMIARAFSRKSYIFAIFMGAFMFAIMHGNPIQFVHQFMLGIVCSVVYFATGSIYASIIVHFTNNFIALVGGYITYLHPFEIPLYANILMVIFGIILLTILLYVFVVYHNKDAKIDGKLKSINAIFKKTFAQNRPDYAQEDKALDIDKQVEETGLEEMKEIYAQEVDLRSQDEKLKAKRALILANLLAIVMLVVNTVTGYIG